MTKSFQNQEDYVWWDSHIRPKNSKWLSENLEPSNNESEASVEHVRLIKEIEDSRKASVEMMSRVRELEEEVVRQRVLISDIAEGKREAIRQLCFTLEHYRDGYKQLRQVLQGENKRHAIMAT